MLVNLEYWELKSPEGSVTLPRRYGPARVRPFPDFTTQSHREYGNRVGIFGMAKLLDKYGVRATVPMDATVARFYPYLVKECLKRNWEIIGHGLTANRLITSQMTEAEERNFIATCVAALKRATGRAPQGWYGVEYSESARTPRLLAEAGVQYVCDWANDEQPYPMTANGLQIYSLPVMVDLDDHTTLGMRNVPITDYVDMVRETLETLDADGAQNGRLFVLNLHPWMMGQPYRLKYLDRILENVTANRHVWNATGSEVVAWCKQHQRA
ncbi:polysaccharide deacetylase family protein [Bradyrhizobium sp. 183]|uniref:polysaccharide deacetylase family protein n=1 Tax=unclassified Bradyrhizobium TaxID=2631580 RepID=UPI001FFFFE70|nr:MULTISPECIES: polysaccharide deacetylase family protein [unclassified Bradyrhizobium]UPJ79294.1 polysaccharide deacetylase family protein [Bradyrhizobium sp. 184]UPJ87087.1 polysaccharide deacetylase family protein [Bradyrhizobium sp. 183]